MTLITNEVHARVGEPTKRPTRVRVEIFRNGVRVAELFAPNFPHAKALVEKYERICG